MASKPKQTLAQSAANGRNEPNPTNAAMWTNVRFREVVHKEK
jgi:hypothetical protein